jgi:outer membrane usher protein
MPPAHRHTSSAPAMRRTRCCIAVTLCLSMLAPARADTAVDFDPAFLVGGAESADLGRFTHGNPVAAGRYRADIYVNNFNFGRDDIELRARPGSDSAIPCLSRQQLEQFGLDWSKLGGPANAAPAAGCVDLTTLIPEARLVFNSAALRLDVSIPQLYLHRNVRGYVDPSQWNSGVNAGILNYNFNSFYSDSQQNGVENYLGLDGGVNLGDWHLRMQSSYNWDGARSQWRNNNLYIQRELPALTSQLTLGDSSTSGELFDSFSLRGVQIASDERMLPDALRGYAPVVRGIANSNARVTIRQNGNVLLETSVAPGPFEINDLLPTGYGGDLEVTITEADGRESKFKVPYASVTRLLRPGAQRYNASFGQYRSGLADNGEKPWVAQLTYQRGLSDLWTGYTGAILAERYQSGMAGAAVNTPVGAFGLDATHATTRLPAGNGAPERTSSGQSMRLSYSKALADTGTNLSVAAYRYSTGGFYSLRDAMTSIRPDFNGYLARQRSSMQLTLNQSLGTAGSLFATASSRNFWDRSGSELQYQLGYSGSTRHFSYLVSALRSSKSNGQSDNQIYASVSIPLDGRISANAGMGFGQQGGNGQVSLSGNAGDRNQLDWNVAANRENSGSQAGSLYAGYRAPYATLSGSASSGTDYKQASFGASGTVVAHPGGVTFGQRAGETILIVEAPDAAGAEVASQPGIVLNDSGYAVVPYLMPYRRNMIELDPKNLPTDVELKSTSQEVVPRAGAVLMAKFETVKGRAVIIDLDTPEGVDVPIGTDVVDNGTGSVGIGRILARGLEGDGTLRVKWGKGIKQQCSIRYSLPERKESGRSITYEHLAVDCVPGGTRFIAMSPPDNQAM